MNKQSSEGLLPKPFLWLIFCIWKECIQLSSSSSSFKMFLKFLFSLKLIFVNQIKWIPHPLHLIRMYSWNNSSWKEKLPNRWMYSLKFWRMKGHVIFSEIQIAHDSHNLWNLFLMIGDILAHWFSRPPGQCHRVCHLKPVTLIGDTITLMSIHKATLWNHRSPGSRQAGRGIIVTTQHRQSSQQ